MCFFCQFRRCLIFVIRIQAMYTQRIIIKVSFEPFHSYLLVLIMHSLFRFMYIIFHIIFCVVWLVLGICVVAIAHNKQCTTPQTHTPCRVKRINIYTNNQVVARRVCFFFAPFFVLGLMLRNMKRNILFCIVQIMHKLCMLSMKYHIQCKS